MRSSPLADRTVVVTGAARGLGAAMARQIAGRGARVALLGHEKQELEALAEELGEGRCGRRCGRRYWPATDGHGGGRHDR
ncbi:SDR family NAD(P)-dependent oxidoreductase, partial [Streptomyces nigra]